MSGPRRNSGSTNVPSGDFVLLGPPGAGKGTQAKALAADGWLQLSTGELFRMHAGKRTALGKRVQEYLDRGVYVPDDLTVDMVRERLAEVPRRTLILFDGFPRTVAQAEALEALLAERGRRMAGALLLDAPRHELLARLAGRARAEGRTDDTPEVIAKRLDVYERETRAVVDYYTKRSLLRRVNAVGPVVDVTRRLREAARSSGTTEGPRGQASPSPVR